jgi:amino acid adenylation domain-containing protein
MLIKKFEDQVRKNPFRISIKSSNDLISYDELNRSANRISHLITKDLGKITQNQVVAVLFDHGPGMITAILGVLKAEKVYVPLSPDYPFKRLSYIVANSEATLILSESKYRKVAVELAVENKISSLILNDRKEDQIDSNPEREVSEDRLAYIMYTSGSTGEPKGVTQNHKNVCYYIRNWTERFSIAGEDHMTLFSSFCHDGSLQDMFSALLSGATLYTYNVKDRGPVDELYGFLIKEKITIWHSVPSLFSYFVATLGAQECFRTLRFVLLGGEAIREYDINMFQKYFPFSTLANVYGQTESSVNSIWKFEASDTFNKIFIGEPLNETEIYVVDKAGNEVDYLQLGEILVSCQHVSPGYWKNEEATQRVFSRDMENGALYWTGDLGRLMLDGQVEFVGRRDQQVKIRGFRIELGEIETQLLRLDNIEEAIVVLKEGTEKEISGNKKVIQDPFLCAYLVSKGSHGSSELREYLLQEIPDYMVPSYFIKLEKMPLTQSGKIDRKALPDPQTSLETDQYIAPENQLEQRLLTLFSEVLQIEEKKIGVGGDFFKLGGHSLKAVTLLSKIHREFQVNLPLKNVFQEPTVRALVGSIKGSVKEEFTSIQKSEKKEYYTVSSAQNRMCILNELTDIGTTYNMYNAIYLDGALDKERLSHSFDTLIKRHESLRTSFRFDQGQYLQILHQAINFQIEIVNKREEQLAEYLQSFIRPFDLNHAPIMRVGLVQVNSNRHLLVYDLHHSISDGVSMGILVKEFVKLYQGERLNELKVQYKDFAGWQNKFFHSQGIEIQKKYWENQLKGKLPVLNMPIDFKRPDHPDFEGNSIKATINKKQLEKLNQLCSAKNVTLNTMIFAVFNLLISQYSDQEELIIGSMVAGRTHVEIENVIGMFGNFIPLRTRINKEETFQQYLSYIQALSLEAYENQDYPFERMIEDLDPPPTGNRNPLFDTMLIFHNEGDARVDLQMHNLTLSGYPFNNKTSKLDFKIDAIVGGVGYLYYFLEYRTALFKEESILEFIESFEFLIRKIIKNPNAQLTHLEIFQEDQKRELSEKRKKNQIQQREKVKLVVSATFTAEPMEDYIRWWGQQFDMKIGVGFAPYHQEFQQLLDPGSMISTNTGINLLLIRVEDWIRGKEGDLSEMIAILQRNFQDFVKIFKNKEKKSDYFLGILPGSPHLDRRVQEEIETLNLSLEKELEGMTHVHIVDFTHLRDDYQITEMYDELANKEGHIPYTMEFYAAMGTQVARNIAALKNKQPLKLIKPLESYTAQDLLGLPIYELAEEEVNLTQYEAPGNELEKELTGIWERLLRREKIGIHDTFFELGGNSLKAVNLISEIHKNFKVGLTLKDVFDQKTIKKLAQVISETEESRYNPIEITEEKEYYPLSSAQRRLYILQQMEPEIIGYNMAIAIEVEGLLSKERLKEAFEELIQRHESLRTSFILVNSSPVQKINKKVDFEIEILKKEIQENKDLAGTFIRPFNLSKAPLLRVGIQENSTGKYFLIVDMHHVISDGISHTLLIQDFFSLYIGKKHAQLRTSYRDYTQWQRIGKHGQLLKKTKEYWLTLFEKEEVPKLSLPIDYKRPSMQSFEGATISFELDPDLTIQLNLLVKEEGATLYMVILAAYNILLYRLSNQTDIVIGTPIAGRQHTDLERVIGIFINTLALRNFPSPEKTIKSFIREVREQSLQAFENQEYHFEDLVDQVVKDRDFSRNPMFDVMFNFQNMGAIERLPGIEETGFKIRPIKSEKKASRFDMTLTGIESAGKLHFSLEYCTKLFKTETIERIINYFKKIILTMVQEKEKEKKLSQIEILSEQEKEKILLHFNETQIPFPYDQTLQHVFETRVNTVPEYISVVYIDQQITYNQLNRRSNQIARVFQGKDVKQGSIVGLMIDRSLEMIEGLFSILKSGAAYLPIGPEYPKERIRYMLQHSEANILLSGKNPQVETESLAFIEMNGDTGKGEQDFNLNLNYHPSDLAYLIYTSGTTGTPKGVMIEHHSLMNFIQGITGIIPFSEETRILSLTTVSFDIFGLETLLPLTMGSRTIIGTAEEQVSALAATKAILKGEISHLQLTPSRLKLFFVEHQEENPFEKLKYLLVGGEPFPSELLEKVKPFINGEIYNMYGPTETTIWSCIKDLSGEDIINIGKPIANTQVYILGGGDSLQPIGVPGELCIAGEGLGRGYFRDKDLSNEKFVECPWKQTKSGSSELRKMYRTGDLALWKDDGNIEFLGRIDHQVKIRGFRIELGEIENKLQAHQGIKEAVLVAKENKKNDQTLVAFMVKEASQEEPGNQFNVIELREYLSRELPDYMMPAQFVCLEKIPLTPNGKIDVRKLKQYEGENLKLGETYVAPGSDKEKRIACLWKELLNLEEVGIQDNFFDLGGNSLNIIQLNSRLKKEFNQEISVVSLFTYPTIRSFIEYLEQQEKSQTFSEKELEWFQEASKKKSRLKNRRRKT